MRLGPGARVGPYEIAAPIGAGGMGEVYRARDTRLNRDIAIKVLPDAFSGDHERLERLQVFVQPFPDPSGGKWQISTRGGQSPRWRPDGRELYYVRADGQLVAVDVSTEGAFQAGRETPLFGAPLFVSTATTVAVPYDVSNDGTRFLLPVPAVTVGDTMQNRSPIIVVLNWTSRLRGR